MLSRNGYGLAVQGEVRNVAAILAATTQKKKPRVSSRAFL
jgi:hypothetical protein